MKVFKLSFIITCFLVLTFSCTSKNKSFDDDDFSTGSETSASSNDLNLDETLGEESAEVKADTKSAEKGSVADEFAEFEDTKSTNPSTTATTEDDLEKEMNLLEAPAAKIANKETPTAPVPISQEPGLDSPPPEISSQNAPNIQPPVTEVTPNVQPPVTDIPTIPTNSISEPPVALSQITTQSSGEINQINSVQYKSNQRGGTVVISSQQPVQFTTRLNSATNQLVVEVQNALIPKNLKRSLNTKDMASSIGSVDIYQKAKSKVARFVIQLRAGSPEPLVQPEGNSLLIVGGSNPTYASKGNSDSSLENSTNKSSKVSNNNTAANETNANSANGSNSDVNPDLTSEGIMNAQSLEDFLASNNKFYGKKISIEAVKLNVNDAFKFLSEESGVNMIIDDDVTGDVTLKLRQVPWDQAFVLILKSKKLGYKRQGNVIRISSVGNLVKEEEDAVKLKEARIGNEPLTVKRFFIGYADIADLEKKIKEFLSSTVVSPGGALIASAPRGKVISDARTSSLIVTETVANLAKIEKFIAALDSQPQQVLIEGKVVEASEKFVRNMGVSWNTPSSGPDAAPARNFIRPSASFQSGITSSIFNPTVGVGFPGLPGDFGNLTASLSLGEKEDKLRVLSAPRIAVLSNQKANISQTVNVNIPTGVTTSADGTRTQNFTNVTVGVTLNVTPQVSNEGTVVMDLDIERSFPGSAVSSEIEKRNAKTKVIVRSGQTAVIGGIFQADSVETISGIPFFKDIPIFGYLFKGQQKSKNKNELVIFVTPRILKPVQGDAPATGAVE